MPVLSETGLVGQLIVPIRERLNPAFKLERLKREFAGLILQHMTGYDWSKPVVVYQEADYYDDRTIRDSPDPELTIEMEKNAGRTEYVVRLDEINMLPGEEGTLGRKREYQVTVDASGKPKTNIRLSVEAYTYNLAKPLASINWEVAGGFKETEINPEDKFGLIQSIGFYQTVNQILRANPPQRRSN